MCLSLGALLPLTLAACGAQESGSEHDRDGGEHGRHGQHGEHGEESGTELTLDQTYGETRRGARLVLAYGAETNSFRGTVTNTTSATLERVRVEVHLSNGKELGPTPGVDLAPGASQEVTLTATSTGFERWNAHPEVGADEHGEGGEHERGGEHGGGGEHR